MAATTPHFDAKRLAQFVALFDSPEEGEAHAAWLRARGLLNKHAMRFVDAIETDAYREAIAAAAKPDFRRTSEAATDREDFSRLSEAFHAYRLRTQADTARLESQLLTEQHISAGLLDTVRSLEACIAALPQQETPGSTPARQGVTVLGMMVLLALLTALGSRLLPSPQTASLAAETRQKFAVIVHRTAQEIQKAEANKATGTPRHAYEAPGHAGQR